MAKGARASTHKANNQRLKAKVFGPVEDERTKRLSAKLLELASQPKSKPDVDMEEEETLENPASESKQTEDMDIDQESKKTAAKPSSGRITKKVRYKSNRKASIVFPKFKDGKKVRGFKGRR